MFDIKMIKMKFLSIKIDKFRYAFPFCALLPPLLLGLFFFSKMEELKIIEERITFLEKKALKAGALPLMTLSKNSDSQYLTRQFKRFSIPIQFQTTDQQKTSLYIESREKQTKPISVNQEELKKILSLVEGIKIDSHIPPQGRPHLLIEEFELNKQDDSHFLLNLQLIKREPL